MCLQTAQKEVKIAKKDLIVYKLFEKQEGNYFVSPYQNFEYKINKLYKTNILEDKDDCAFDELSRKIRLKSKKRWKSYGKGFHAALYKNRFENTEDDAFYGLVVKCVIPKNSKYYVGFGKLIISNQIIVIGEIVEYKD